MRLIRVLQRSEKAISLADLSSPSQDSAIALGLSASLLAAVIPPDPSTSPFPSTTLLLTDFKDWGADEGLLAAACWLAAEGACAWPVASDSGRSEAMLLAAATKPTSADEEDRCSGVGGGGGDGGAMGLAAVIKPDLARSTGGGGGGGSGANLCCA